MSENFNFQIIIEGGFSERFIGIVEPSEIADYLTLGGDEDQGFSDFCQDELKFHWSDMPSWNQLHENGVHMGSIIVKQNDNTIFHIDIEKILDEEGTSSITISEMAKYGFDNGLYYLRIEWEGSGDKIELEGEVNEYSRDGWKENFAYVFSPSVGDTGVIEYIQTESNIGNQGEIDLTEVDRPNPSGSDELIVARGNVGGETKTIVGLAELISIMEKDNVDLSEKEEIMNYLNKFISK